MDNEISLLRASEDIPTLQFSDSGLFPHLGLILVSSNLFKSVIPVKLLRKTLSYFVLDVLE